MKYAIRSLAKAVIITLALSLSAHAELSDMPSGAYALDKSHGYITFSYNHLGFSTPHVGFRNFDVELDLDSANIENSNVTVLIDATSIDSRVEEFNGHLSGDNFFDTANHPEITFVSTEIKSTGDDTFDIIGDLTIRGTTLQAVLNATLLKAANHPMRKVPTIGATARTAVNRSDFGMTRGLPMISDEVTIDISVELPQKTGD
ncbi:MAG: YceI family protein [Woeseiaceae bacterium]